MFSGGCVFVYHTSGYVIINHKVAINATETVKAKLTFEKKTQSQVVVIKGYHTDNGIFNASEFMEGLFKKHQKIRFSGAGASHQNGAAESAIKTVVNTESVILMQSWMICHKEKLYIDFGKLKCNTIYGSKVGSLIYSMVYKPLGKF